MLSKFIFGLECGGLDGFFGIFVNLVFGYVLDILVVLGGIVILFEFLELNGVE